MSSRTKTIPTIALTAAAVLVVALAALGDEKGYAVAGRTAFESVAVAVLRKTTTRADRVSPKWSDARPERSPLSPTLSLPRNPAWFGARRSSING